MTDEVDAVARLIFRYRVCGSDPFEGVFDANRAWDLVLNESY